MRLNRITLQNWRNHANTEIRLDQINVLVGPNNAGKSSIVAAIEYALSGRCQWTDGRGGGADLLIRQGEKSATVAVEIEGLGEVRRQVYRSSTPTKLQVADWTGGVEAQQEQLYRTLGIGRDVIAALVDAMRVADLKPEEQRDLLFRVAGFAFTKAGLRDHVAEAAGGDADVIRLFDQAPDVAGGPEVFDQLYKHFYNARRDAKRDYQHVKADLDALQARQPNIPEGMTLDDLPRAKELLQKLRAQRDQLLRRGGADTAAEIARIEAQLEQIDRDVEVLREQIAETRATLDEIGQPNARLANAQAARNAAQGKYEDAQAALAQVKAQLALLDAGFVCPACGFNSAEPDSKQRKALERERKRLEKAVADAEAAVAQARDHLAECDKELREAQELADQHERLTKENYERSNQVVSLNARRAKLEARLKELQAAAEASNVDAEVARLDERIAKGEQIVSALESAAQFADLVTKHEAGVQALAADVEALETLVALFGPSGLKQQFLGRLIEDLNTRATALLDALAEGYTIRFEAEPFTILVNDLPLPNLSESERMRVGIVLQILLADLAGAGWLLIDAADRLDPANRGRLIGLLLDVRDRFDTVIVLATRGDVEPRDPGIPGVQVLLVEDGRVRSLAEVAA